MNPEAKQEVKQEAVPEVKKRVPEWQGISTDLSSFTAFGVVTLSDGQRVNVQMTNRHGLAFDKMYADYKEYVKFLDMCAQDHNVEYWDGSRNNGDSKTPPAKSSDGSAPAANNGNGSTEKPARKWNEPVPQGELPAELVDITVNIFTQDFDVIKVLPQPDEKVTVQFWKDKLEYPVGAYLNNAKYSTFNDYFATMELTESIDPSKAGQYRIAGVQYWKEGSAYTNKKGVPSHYKDIVLLKPAF